VGRVTWNIDVVCASDNQFVDLGEAENAGRCRKPCGSSYSTNIDRTVIMKLTTAKGTTVSRVVLHSLTISRIFTNLLLNQISERW